MHFSEHATHYLLRNASTVALVATQLLVDAIEPDPEYRQLAHALLAVGEGSDLRGLLSLDLARRAFLDEACFRTGASGEEAERARAWLTKRFEERLQRESGPTGDWPLLAAQPVQSGDRLVYFLWQATRLGMGHRKGIAALTPLCYRALRSRLRREAQVKKRKGGADEDLPFEMAILVRFYPKERLTEEGKLTTGVVTHVAVREAVRRYYKSPRSRIKNVETRDRYVKQIARTLFGDDFEKRRFHPGGSPLPMHFSAKSALGFDTHRRVIADEDKDEDSRSIGLLAWQETDDGFEHPFESAQYVQFGSWRANHEARASWRWTTRERRVVTPNEIIRLTAFLDRIVNYSGNVDAALFIWLALITGLPIKRLMSMRLLDESLPLEALLETARSKGEAPIYLSTARGVILVTPHEELDDHGRLIDEQIYRAKARLVPLWVGVRGLRYISALMRWREGSDSPFVFPRSLRHPRPRTPDYATGRLSGISHRIQSSSDLLTWSKLGASLRPYAVEAGLTPLLSGLAGDHPTRPLGTILHYVAYDSLRLFSDHARAVDYIESVASGSVGAGKGKGRELDPALIPLVEGCLGSAYVPLEGLVTQAWKAICARTSATPKNDHSRYLNALTLRTAFALMASTGIRLQELSQLRRARLDLVAGLLRVEGKQSAYFREAREIPLPQMAIKELRAYVKHTASLQVVKDSDPLFVEAMRDGSVRALTPDSLRRIVESLGLSADVPFSLRTLRHALRTSLHEQGAPFEAVNEAFGHVTMEETVTHRLSGHRLPDISADSENAHRSQHARCLGVRNEAMDRRRCAG
jgi:Phage integrase family